MFTKYSLQKRLINDPLVKLRLATLKRAEEINSDFKNPHIAGGYLRNIALGCPPNDCDVVFKGYCLNQPGIVEAVKQAEKELGIKPYPEWDFENTLATGISKDFYENMIGKYANHTDYLTVLMMDTKGNLYVGPEKTLEHLEKRIYDFRFEGIEIWANHRGGGRSYASCIVGDMTRGLYLCQALDLHPSEVVKFLWSNYDSIFQKLAPDDQEARKNYWVKKTKGDPKYQKLLVEYKITSLRV